MADIFRLTCWFLVGTKSKMRYKWITSPYAAAAASIIASDMSDPSDQDTMICLMWTLIYWGIQMVHRKWSVDTFSSRWHIFVGSVAIFHAFVTCGVTFGNVKSRILWVCNLMGLLLVFHFFLFFGTVTCSRFSLHFRKR